MAQITKLAQVLQGLVQNVDISANDLATNSIYVGGSSGTQLTQTILDHLVALQNGTDFSTGTNSHTHDGRYNTKTQEASATGGSSGSMLIGDDNSYSNFTPTAATVKGALAGIDAALTSATTALDGTFKIENTSDPTKIMVFDVSGVLTGTTRTLKMANANVDLANLTNSNISGSAAIAYSKLNLSGSIVDADINTSAAIALTKLAALSTHNRVLVSDSSGVISESSVSTTTLGYLDATSSIQTQLNATEKTANKGTANGYASLDSGGKVPASQLPNSVMELQGTWNASTNTPTLADGTGNIGDVYYVNVAGTQDLGSGSQTFAVKDWVFYTSGGIWQLAHAGADAVQSVNGSAGVVTVNAINQLTGDVTAGPASGSQSQVATIAAGAVTATKLGTVTDGVTLDQSGAGSTLEVKAGGISNTQVNASAAIAYSKLALSGSIVNADINSSAAIAYSKLSLTGSIINADVSTSAAIAYSKLSLSNSIVNADIASGAAIAYSKLALSNSIVAGDLTSQSVTAAKIATAALDQTTITGGNGTTLSVAYAPAMQMPMVAGESMAANTSFLVRMALNGETAGRVYKADASAAAANGKFWAIGICGGAGAISAGDTAQVILFGTWTLGSSDTPFNSTNIGMPVWLTTSGGFSITPPATSGYADYKIGVVQSTTTILLDSKQLTGVV